MSERRTTGRPKGSRNLKKKKKKKKKKESRVSPPRRGGGRGGTGHFRTSGRPPSSVEKKKKTKCRPEYWSTSSYKYINVHTIYMYISQKEAHQKKKKKRESLWGRVKGKRGLSDIWSTSGIFRKRQSTTRSTGRPI